MKGTVWIATTVHVFILRHYHLCGNMLNDTRCPYSKWINVCNIIQKQINLKRKFIFYLIEINFNYIWNPNNKIYYQTYDMTETKHPHMYWTLCLDAVNCVWQKDFVWPRSSDWRVEKSDPVLCTLYMYSFFHFLNH